MAYFDSSYIAKCYLNEPGAGEVRALAATFQGLFSCELGRLEFFSVLQRHLREGKLTAEQVQQVEAHFDEDESAGVWLWLPVTSSLLRQAGTELRRVPATVFVRASDALHLVCAKNHGFTEVHTNDRHMLAAASSFGVIGKNVIPAGT